MARRENNVELHDRLVREAHEKGRDLYDYLYEYFKANPDRWDGIARRKAERNKDKRKDN